MQGNYTSELVTLMISVIMKNIEYTLYICIFVYRLFTYEVRLLPEIHTPCDSPCPGKTMLSFEIFSENTKSLRFSQVTLQWFRGNCLLCKIIEMTRCQGLPYRLRYFTTLTTTGINCYNNVIIYNSGVIMTSLRYVPTGFSLLDKNNTLWWAERWNFCYPLQWRHMMVKASQITGNSTVYSTDCTGL